MKMYESVVYTKLSFQLYGCFLAPATLTNVSGDQSVREETNLQLYCEATGKPTPNITWTKLLEDGSNSGVLQHGPTMDFTNINRNDSGTYHCTAYNGFGNPVSRSVNVDVTCKYVYTGCTFMHFPIIFLLYIRH